MISAYPISPQTHIVEHLSDLVRTGDLEPCEYLMVESEFAAMSARSAPRRPARAPYTATASQGLLYMVEALYNASGLGLPIVMTVANRAIGAPINIWNDHSDSMSQRDSGWIQLYAETNQEALDMHIQAFRIAEEVSLPVMVCMDGFILTHAYEEVDIPEQAQVDAFLPAFEPRQVLDPADPVTIGAMVGPEAFFEVKYLAHAKQMQAMDLIPEVATEFASEFGASRAGSCAPTAPRTPRRSWSRSARCWGRSRRRSTSCATRGSGSARSGLKSFRPFPLEEVRGALGGAQRVVVLEKALAVGIGGIVSANVRTALSGIQLHGYTVIAGLGGRSITKESLLRLFEAAVADELKPLSFLDLKSEIVERELARVHADRASGPHEENILQDIGVVAAEPH